MCWKNEWARAVNNVESAKIHIRRARAKVECRGLFEAVERCDNAIQWLERIQENLNKLIADFGITSVKGSRTTETLLKGQRKVRMV